MQSTTLCNRCAKIPLETSKLYDVANGLVTYGEDGKGVVCRLRGFSDADCELCCLFRETAAKYGLKGEIYRMKAKICHSSKGGALPPSSYFQLPQRHPVNENLTQKPQVPYPPLLDQPGLFLQLAEVDSLYHHGYIGLHQHASTNNDGLRNLSTRDIKPDSVYWNYVKEWLRHCESQQICRPDPLRHFLLSGFSVIETVTRRVIPAPVESEYVALSYVWGVPESEKQLSASFLPFPAPLTIEDAITSIRALGFTYLWVNRYCINQISHTVKNAMIQNMDKIYMSATLTLVDTTGSSSHDGLAGVSRRRSPPKRFPVHGLELSVISNVRSEVHQSKWSSRGRTYQEAVFSRRRLVFSHSQVYFQCLEMHCCESLAAYLESDTPWGRDKLAGQLQVFLCAGRGMEQKRGTRLIPI